MDIFPINDCPTSFKILFDENMNEYCTLDIHDYAIFKNENRLDFAKSLGNMCITAFHTTIPYVVNFLHDGWFSWERGKDTVFAFCPAGHVEMEIQKLNHYKTQIRISRVYGNCPKHQLGDKFMLNNQDESFNVVDSIFPVLLYLSKNSKTSASLLDVSSRSKIVISKNNVSENLDKNNFMACEIEQEIKEHPVFIDVVGMKRTCKYHRHARLYNQEELVPKHMCGFAYHAMYPTILTMLYNGKTSNRISLPCPGLDDNVIFLIERTPKSAKIFLEIAEKILRLLKIPLDIISMNISMSVIHKTGDCIDKLKVGDRFRFGDKKVLCASSFDNLFGVMVKNSNNRVQCNHVFQCTSKACRIQYKLTRDG